LTAGREGNGSAVLGRIIQAATHTLHPPVVLGQVPEGVDRIIGIAVVVVWVRTALCKYQQLNLILMIVSFVTNLAVHAFDKGCRVGGRARDQEKSSRE
jgi:hypothetical protein